MALVQSFGIEQDTASGTIATPSTQVSDRSTLVVMLSGGGNPNMSVSDGVNTFVQVDTQFDSSDNQTYTTFIANNIRGGNRAITGSFGVATPTFRLIQVVELSGRAASALDQHMSAQAVSTTATDNVASGVIRPSADQCDLVGFLGIGDAAASGTGWAPAPSTGFIFTEVMLGASPSPVAATWTDAGGANRYAAFILALKPARGTAAFS